MLGWLRADTARASSRNRARKIGSEESAAESTLIATGAVQPLVRGAKNGAHSAGAQLAFDPVGANQGSYRESSRRHRLGSRGNRLSLQEGNCLVRSVQQGRNLGFHFAALTA